MKNLNNTYGQAGTLSGLRIPMNLQIFAEVGNGAGADGGNGGGAAGGGTEGGAAGGVENKSMSFDEFLANRENQAEFDRRVQKATQTAITNAQEKWRLLTDDKVSEAEKLARMTKEEKAEYMHNKHVRELSDREAQITRRELMAEAKNTLSEKGLPVALADVLTYTDADSCNKSIAALEKAFNAAVQAAVEDKLKGDKPPKGAPQSDTVTKEQFAKMGYADRLKLKTDNPELYKQLLGM